MPDRDGYPTDDELDAIRSWQPGLVYSDAGQLRAWFALIKAAWWAKDWGWSEEKTTTQTTIFLSTGGWSGNEAIISAMQENWIPWSLTWASSRRGGHYTFTIPGNSAP